MRYAARFGLPAVDAMVSGKRKERVQKQVHVRRALTRLSAGVPWNRSWSFGTVVFPSWSLGTRWKNKFMFVGP
jgi:hypothetical protein